MATLQRHYHPAINLIQALAMREEAVTMKNRSALARAKSIRANLEMEKNGEREVRSKDLNLKSSVIVRIRKCRQ